MTRAAATPATATDGRESAPDSQVPGELLASVAAPRLMLTELSGIAPSTTPGDSGVEDSNRIYSRTDPDVTPPRNVYPKFPTQSPWSDVSSRTVLELTIAQDGVVEHVRMLTTPRNIHEFMLLSAAKAWRFEPARIGGRPVRFRHTIAVDARPGVWASSK